MHERNLQRIEHRLLRERERSLRGLHRLSRDAGELLDRGGTELSGHPSRLADLASDLAEREKTFFLASKEGRYFYRIQDALRRLYEEPESFGRCQRCGEDIPFERLDALPHVRFCLACKVDEEAVEAPTRSARASNGHREGVNRTASATAW